MTGTPAPDEIVRLHAVVYGEVQGVGFRAATQREAAALGLTGWVCNQWDGSVETVAEGPRAAIDAFAAFLHRGPRAAFVTHIESTIETATGEFTGFSIRY